MCRWSCNSKVHVETENIHKNIYFTLIYQILSLINSSFKFLKLLSSALQQMINIAPVICRMAFCEAKRFLKNEVRLFV